MSTEPTFVVDSSWYRPNDATTVVAGSPLTVFRLSEAGREIARALEGGATLPEFHPPLTSRFVLAGAIHPVATATRSSLVDVLTVVIPAHVTDDASRTRLHSLVESLSTVCRVIVVDDASPIALAESGRAELLRLSANRGPAAARNAGAATATTPFIAFVDADVTGVDDALGLLVSTCEADGVALAAPRVASRPNGTRLGRYEEMRSPLDCGRDAGRVRAGTRVSYVPSATWVVRTEVWSRIGGFDESMRVGEDVDFVWRAVRAGWTCRYEPRAVVQHEPRSSLRSFTRQRFTYGTSVADLARRHPGDFRVLRMSWHSFVLWVSFFVGLIPISALLGVYTFVVLARRLRNLDNGTRIAWRLVTKGHLHALASIARVLRREWIPITTLGMLSTGSVSFLMTCVLVIPPLVEYVRGARKVNPFVYVVLRFIDDAAYGWGAVTSCVRRRTFRPFVPDLRTWRADVN